MIAGLVLVILLVSGDASAIQDTVQVEPRSLIVPPASPESVVVVLPIEFQSFLLQADEVRAFLTAPEVTVRREVYDGLSDGPIVKWTVLEFGRDISEEEGVHLGRILADTTSFLKDTKHCLFHSEIGYAFHLDRDSLVVLVDHGCARVQFVHNREVQRREIDPAAAELLTVTRGIFPEHPWFRRLEERAQERQQ